MVNETWNDGVLKGISARKQDNETPRIGYIQHLLLLVGKGWVHADNLALRLWRKNSITDLKQYQLTAVINELRAQAKDLGKPL